MKLTAGMLREIIKEEVEKAKSHALREGDGDMPLPDLEAIAEELAAAGGIREFERNAPEMLDELGNYVCSTGRVDRTRQQEMITLLSSKLFRLVGRRADPQGMAEEAVYAACTKLTGRPY